MSDKSGCNHVNIISNDGWYCADCSMPFIPGEVVDRIVQDAIDQTADTLSRFAKAMWGSGLLPDPDTINRGPVEKAVVPDPEAIAGPGHEHVYEGGQCSCGKSIFLGG